MRTLGIPYTCTGNAQEIEAVKGTTTKSRYIQADRTVAANWSSLLSFFNVQVAHLFHSHCALHLVSPHPSRFMRFFVLCVQWRLLRPPTQYEVNTVFVADISIDFLILAVHLRPPPFFLPCSLSCSYKESIE